MVPRATDIGNVYLKAKTTEKLYIRVGLDFGEIEGHVLIIDKLIGAKVVYILEI